MDCENSAQPCFLFLGSSQEQISRSVDERRANLSTMTFEEFQDSLQHDDPPKGPSLGLTGLWWDARGDWTKAHESARQDEGPMGAWVQAYLHRKEGGASNAAFWYQRTGEPASRRSLIGMERDYALAAQVIANHYSAMIQTFRFTTEKRTD